MGEITAEFESAFAGKMNVKHAVAVANCTAALHLANLAAGVGAGAEVICPRLTFVATASASLYTGATVVFADVISKDDLTVCPRDIERKITSKTKAIAVMHYAGFPCLMDDILTVARRHGVPVIEDCAHAPFAWLPEAAGLRRYVGAIGDFGCFSFFGNKNMTTGEGGMLTTNDDQLAARVRLLRSHGMTSLTYDRHKGHAAQYDVTALGYNYRMDELRAAIGLCQLRKIDALNEGRRRVYRWYTELLAGSPDFIVPFAERDLDQSACHIMPVLVRREREEEVRRLLREAGVQTSRHYEPVDNLTLYRRSTQVRRLFTGFELLTLPLAAAMTSDQVEFVIQTIRAPERVSVQAPAI
jgi:dTDP-4-amino-4,6-dideoxygalactose transaminase